MCTGDVLLGLLQSFLDVVGPLQENLGLLFGPKGFFVWRSGVELVQGASEYGIGWLPLGGYVKISGMIDESLDKEQLQRPAEPWRVFPVLRRRP